MPIVRLKHHSGCGWGFTASPIQGTPQGIAVYQNGVRVNESWGDVVNWDFIPERAINKVSLYPSNPAFGLNAVGGALSIEMKNGFTYQGTELEALVGSYGRVQSSVQAGRQDGNFSAYALFESAYDKGWRDFASSSHLNRMYVDVGARNDDTELHVSFTGAGPLIQYELITEDERTTVQVSGGNEVLCGTVLATTRNFQIKPIEKTAA